MNHSIHTLAALGANGKQQQHHQQQQQQQHAQFHHTLHSHQALIDQLVNGTQQPASHNQQQPSPHEPHQQQMLQFQNTMHHQHQHHPYSTLQHHQNQLNAHSQTLNFGAQQAAMSQHNGHLGQLHQPSHSVGSQLPPSQHHLPNNQYNLNSDYSSSTYHIYDQISDLIIIKQQRMERRRQQERRRRQILLALGATLMIGALSLLILQMLFGSSSSSSSQTSTSSTSSLSAQNRSPASGDLTTSSSESTLRDEALSQRTPSGGSKNSEWPFDAARLKQQPQPQSVTPMTNKVIQQQQQQPLDGCGPHGSIVISPQMGGAILCKCELGYWGDQCELSATAPNPMLARCLLTNCNGNGKCDYLGRCRCFPGFTGPFCELRATSSIAAASTSIDANSPSSRQVNGAAEFVINAPTQTNSPSQQVSSIQATQVSNVVSSDGPQNQHIHAACKTKFNNCNGNGHCTVQGFCKCFPGFTGDACQEHQIGSSAVSDPCATVRCGGQGHCVPSTGQCQCKFGYRGALCEQRDDEQWALLFNCSSHGKYDHQRRKCNCDPGFTGFDCSEERCPELPAGQQAPNCGPNGLYDCRQSKCICQDGFSGDLCQVQECSPQCQRNGQCLDGQCVCQPGFYGRHCTFNGCPNECGGRGQCVRTSDTGVVSQQMAGIIQEWRCQCRPGFVGDDCSLQIERNCDDGIDNDRDGLVDCADSECCADKVCASSPFCPKSPDPLDILMRKQPSPPTSSFFQRMQFLIGKSSSQPYSNLKDFSDSLSASKYDRASVVRGKVTYLKQGVTGVRVSVAEQKDLEITFTREGGFFDLMVNGGGAVVLEFRREPFATYRKAVRVPWNEIVLVENIELRLESPELADLSPEVVKALSPSQSSESALPGPEASTCSAHNYRMMRPLLVAAPKSSRFSHWWTRRPGPGGQSSRAVILRDSGTVQQSILLPGSAPSRQADPLDPSNHSVALVYISSRANDFMSTVTIQLTPPQGPEFKLPAELKLIYLRIVIEGNLFEQVFEPQANLSFTYAWNRRNVYRQKSFGVSTALVSVGYEYFDCRQVIWSSRNIQLAGHDLSNSDIGGQWNLNIHHRYNYRDSILQRGDGQNFNLKTDKPRVVVPLLGDGYSRPTTCPSCDGATQQTEQRLLRPSALVAAPDGSIYIGDGNLIRSVESVPGTSERIVRSVLELSSSRVSTRYGLALNLADGHKLHMADPERYQVFLVRDVNIGSAANINSSSTTPSSAGEEAALVPVAGNGDKCQIQGSGSSNQCGDGQSARLARLVEPRAIVFDLSGRMYVADGPNVRFVEPKSNKIYTLLGDYGVSRHTKFPCTVGEAIPLHRFVPRAPQDLAMSPLDDTLHLLDDNVVYKITRDKRVQIVAGRPAHCPLVGEASSKRTLRATEFPLQSAQWLAFSATGELYIAEDDQRGQQSARILVVSPEEDSISLFAGSPAERSASTSLPPVATADALTGNLEAITAQDNARSSNALPLSPATRALEYRFGSVGAIAVDQQGKLLIADKLQLRLLSVEPDLPQMNSASEYELQSPDNPDELFVFNRFGHHIATREIGGSGVVSSFNAQSGSTHVRAPSSNKYIFSYNVNTSFGQLASVSYSSGNKISIVRDVAAHYVKLIETAFGGQCKLEVSRNGQVQSIQTIAPNASRTTFSYQLDGGLLRQSRDQASGETFDFQYDEFGRALAIQHVSPRLPIAVECRANMAFGPAQWRSNYLSQQCSNFIVAD